MSNHSEVRVASSVDLPYVLALQRRWSNQLGFLPNVAVADYVSRGRVRLVTANGDPVGYVLGSPSMGSDPGVANVVQAAVQLDAQRLSFGRQLIAAVEKAAVVSGRNTIQCWCRADLEAVRFWRAAGFVAVAVKDQAAARGFPLVLFRRCTRLVSRDEFWRLPLRSGSLNTAVREVISGRGLKRPLEELIQTAVSESLPLMDVVRDSKCLAQIK